MTAPVLRAEGETARIDRALEDRLIALAEVHGKARILLHGDPAAKLHEMVIAADGDQFWPPHPNPSAEKSWRALRGRIGVALFDGPSAERIDAVHVLSPDAIAELRLSADRWHTVAPLDAMVVYKETALGPHRATRFSEPADGREALRDRIRARAERDLSDSASDG